MAEYASKGVAGSGLGLGIAGLSVALLQGANGNGLLGGIFGGNQNNALAAVMSENAALKGENYADKVSKEVYQQSLADNRRTEERINALLAPVAASLAELQKEVAVNKAVIDKNLEINQLKMDNCCCQMNGKIDSLAQATANLANVVSKITSTVIPQTAICPEVMPRYNSWTAPTTTTPAG